MASGRYNTMSEGLQKIATDLTLLMATPDADLDFLAELQTQILTKMREPWDAMTGAGGAGGMGGPPPPDAGLGQPPPEIAAMMGGGMGPQGIMPAGGPPLGGSMPPMSPGAPNPDELRRLMDGGI